MAVYYVICSKNHSSSEIKCHLKVDALLFLKLTYHLHYTNHNSTLNLINSVNKSNIEIKMHFLKQAYHAMQWSSPACNHKCVKRLVFNCLYCSLHLETTGRRIRTFLEKCRQSHVFPNWAKQLNTFHSLLKCTWSEHEQLNIYHIHIINIALWTQIQFKWIQFNAFL